MRWSVVVLMAGCAGKDAAVEEDPCIETTVELAIDEVNPLGFTLQEVEDFLAPPFAASILWSRGEVSRINWAFAPGSDPATYVTYTQDPEVDAVCATSEAVWVFPGVTLSTEDGRVAEGRVMPMNAVAANDLTLTTNVNASGTDCPIGEGSEMEAVATFGSTGTHGTFECQGEHTWFAAEW